ncbi:MAG TPA: M14 metallopeptidase family protein [Thermoanaerobaculia bacterium]|nr:M14 metallopeptidase family protein [Thermoanaerobaculia bacterium]
MKNLASFTGSMTAVALALLLQAGAALAADQVPTPESSFGFAPCAERRLATYEEIERYFRALDAASNRIEVFDIGATAEGRTQILSIISSEENMAQLERWREIAERLARAQDLSDEEARALAREGKAVVWIDFGLHSTERAHAQTAPWLAHLAVSEETPEWHSIRDQVIFLLLPNLNPDGTTMVAEWYREHVGTPYEEAPLPELYQKYVGHDNNRDWFMFNQPESRNVGRLLYHQWYPQIVYNQHQEAPFPARIFLPPFEDPMNPNIPALVMRGINLVGEAMGRRFDQESKSGALSRVNFDTWWNGGMRTAPYFHNMVGILTETGHSSPASMVYDPEKFPSSFGSTGVSTSDPSTFYPNPFEGGEWHFRNSCEYMITGSMAVLDIGAKRREEWLYDIYRMGRDAIERGAGETYVIPAGQWDDGTAARLVDVLRWGGVEVDRAASAFSVGEGEDRREYAAGSYLVRGAQAFRPYVTDLLNPQVYPDRRLYPGGPPELPYDITGWTLPLQMGVEVVRHEVAVDVRTEPVEWAAVPAAETHGGGRWGWALDPRANDAFTVVNRLLAAGIPVSRLAAPLSAARQDWPAGSFLIENDEAAGRELDRHTGALGVERIALRARPAGEIVELRTPRLGVYHAWGGNIDEGWTRWVLEQFEFRYERVHDADVRAGELAERFDVILLPDASLASMHRGLDADLMPAPYAGGMTSRGLFHLLEFVDSGGTLVALDSASELPLTLLDLEIRNVTERRSSDSFFVPGTILRLAVDTSHPLAWGVQPDAAAFFARSPAFEIGRRASRSERQRGIEPEPPEAISVAARWAEEDLLLSGWMLGGSVLEGNAAVVEAEVEEGRVILLGLRSQHRGQPHGTFKLLFNSIYRGAS